MSMDDYIEELKEALTLLQAMVDLHGTDGLPDGMAERITALLSGQ
jgi:hypothetical protein